MSGRRTLAAGAVLLGVLAAAVPSPAAADVLFPTETKVFFERHGKPVEERVRYTVRCFGYWTEAYGEEHPKAKGTYKPEEVFSYSADCASYGCVIHEPYYMNHRVLASCDMEGKVGDRPFKLHDFAETPVDFSACKDREVELRDCTLRVQLPD